MPSKDILSIILFISITTIPFLNAAQIDCMGHELSALSNNELEKLTEKQCTHVRGDIVLRNIDKPVKKPCYLSIQHLEGSIIIENTKDLHNWVNLQNLITINSGSQPAILIRGNKDLHLGLGAKLKSVESTNENTFIFLDNANSVIDHNTFNILRFTSKAPVFLTDAYIDVEACSSELYKTIAMLIAFFVVMISTGLCCVSFYGRDVGSQL